MPNRAIIPRKDFLGMSKKLGIKAKYMQYLHMWELLEKAYCLHLVVYSRPRFPKATALTCVLMQEVSGAVQMLTYPIGSGLGQVLIKLTVLSCPCARVQYQGSSIILLPSSVLLSSIRSLAVISFKLMLWFFPWEEFFILKSILLSDPLSNCKV